MKKKILYILITAVLICTAFYIGRNTAPTKTTTKTVTVMPEKVDLSNKDQFNYICDFMAEISDWNCGGGTNDELAVSTKDGSCIIVHLWEQIYINDEMVLEQMIEPTGNFKYLMQSVIDDGMKKDLHKAEINNDELKKSNRLYSDFIKALGTQYAEMFKEFCNKEAQNI